MARKVGILSKTAAAAAAAEYVARVAADKGRLPAAVVAARETLFAFILAAPVGVHAIAPATLAATCRSDLAGTPGNARSDCETLRNAFRKYFAPEHYNRTEWVAADGTVTVEVFPAPEKK